MNQAESVAEPSHASDGYRLLDIPPAPRSRHEWDDRMVPVRERFHAAGISSIYLLNGTFCGDDPFGFFTSLDPWVPGLTRLAREKTIRMIDATFGESGNFLPGYAAAMEHGLQRDDGRGPRVERLYWSGENHHFGRVAGAIAFLDDLFEQSWGPEDRLLFLAQSHGGNVLALMSCLLSGSLAWRDQFFDAVEAFARTSAPETARPAWLRVRERLERNDLPVRPEQLDFVTLGTPIVYPFAKTGCGKLLHIVNHRPRPGLPAEQTSLPRSLAEFPDGADGDYVHQIGITGSNFAPSWLCPRQWLANHRLRRLLGGEKTWRRYFPALAAGVRVREGATVHQGQLTRLAGETLLIDYGLSSHRRAAHMFGHGVYTHRRHLVPQLELIASSLYDAR